MESITWDPSRLRRGRVWPLLFRSLGTWTVPTQRTWCYSVTVSRRNSGTSMGRSLWQRIFSLLPETFELVKASKTLIRNRSCHLVPKDLPSTPWVSGKGLSTLTYRTWYSVDPGPSVDRNTVVSDTPDLVALVVVNNMVVVIVLCEKC